MKQVAFVPNLRVYYGTFSCYGLVKNARLKTSDWKTEGESAWIDRDIIAQLVRDDARHRGTFLADI